MMLRAMERLVLLGVLFALPAFGQEQAIQRELIMRQQQSDAFTLQLRQSQQQLHIPPGDVRRRAEVETSQLLQRRELDNLSARQLTEAGRDTPAALAGCVDRMDTLSRSRGVPWIPCDMPGGRVA